MTLSDFLIVMSFGIIVGVLIGIRSVVPLFMIKSSRFRIAMLELWIATSTTQEMEIVRDKLNVAIIEKGYGETSEF